VLGQGADTQQDGSASETSASSEDSDSSEDSKTLQRLVREQAEMFQLFQLLAGQVESLQGEVEELREAAEQEKNKPTVAARPRRPRPDPAAVYSIPIVDNPSSGSNRPLVTITESFEFA
jgi:hypothetical protein